MATAETHIGMKARGYSMVFLVLVGVTLVSLLTAEIMIARSNASALPARNSIILGISTIKTLMIVAFYMHLKFETRPVVMVAAIPILFLAILMSILVGFPNQGYAGAVGAGPLPHETPAAPGGHEPTPQPSPTPAASPTVEGPKGDAAAGEAVFKGKGLSIACSTCHTPGSDRLVGPGLKGVGAKGEAHVRESIVDPSAKIAEGFRDAMPKAFARELCGKETRSAAELAGCKNLDDLVAYLLSLQ